MKYKMPLLTCMLIMFVLTACSRSHEIQNSQQELHKKFLQHCENILHATSTAGQEYIQILQNNYRTNQTCPETALKNELSSIYIPKSAKHGNQLNCLMQASQMLDNKWKRFYDTANYISWIYVYDNNTKGLRIHPATNPRSLFGDDLTFESFNFYKDAVAKFPMGSWSGARDDINGTGKIIIYSQALKLPKQDEYAVVGIDVKTEQILRPFHEEILDFSQQINSPHVFLITFMRRNQQYIPIHYFTTSPEKWSLLKSTYGEKLNIPKQEQAALASLEETALKTPETILSKRLTLNHRKHLCSMFHVQMIAATSLLCSEQ